MYDSIVYGIFDEDTMKFTVVSFQSIPRGRQDMMPVWYKDEENYRDPEAGDILNVFQDSSMFWAVAPLEEGDER